MDANKKNSISLGTFSVDTILQANGKYDVYIAHEGSSGSHYADITADKVGKLLADDIICVADAVSEA